MSEWSKIPEEIRDHLHEAALRENELRDHGATAERIKSDAGQRFGPATARLALKYPGQYPFPPEKPQEPKDTKPEGMQKWAQDFQKRADVDNDPDDGPEPDWRERQFKDH